MWNAYRRFLWLTAIPLDLSVVCRLIDLAFSTSNQTHAMTNAHH